ncbi:hypothetical protein chiPu_0027259, partial [Chiloscyllium punctatum]|nr:hypothetical protein [Chiloscyllium punctatum]
MKSCERSSWLVLLWRQGLQPRPRLIELPDLRRQKQCARRRKLGKLAGVHINEKQTQADYFSRPFCSQMSAHWTVIWTTSDCGTLL